MEGIVVVHWKLERGKERRRYCVFIESMYFFVLVRRLTSLSTNDPLGRHRLKDVPNATQLFQLVAPDMREDFPPLKTLSATSLPALNAWLFRASLVWG